MKKMFLILLFMVVVSGVLTAQNNVNGDPIVSGGYFVNGVQSFGIGIITVILKNNVGVPIGIGYANTYAGNAYVLGTLDVVYFPGNSIEDVKGIEVVRNTSGKTHHDFTFDVIPPTGFLGKNINVTTGPIWDKAN